MKGSNKDFNRYLDYELNDYYLEPLEKSKQNLFQSDKVTKHKQPYHDDTSSQPLMEKEPKNPYGGESHTLRDLIISMDDDGSDLRRMHKFMTSSQRQFEKEFNSPPFMCLTTNLGKQVSLWQYSHISSSFNCVGFKAKMVQGRFQLLTLLPFTQKEKTVDTRFINDDWFYIVSTEDGALFNVRFYDIKVLSNAINAAKANPESHSIPPIGSYSFKLVIRNYNTLPDNQKFVHVALWKNEIITKIPGPDLNSNTEQNPDLGIDDTTNGTENIVKVIEKTYKGTHIPSGHNTSNLSYILRASNGVTMLVDRAYSNYIVWSEESIVISNYHAGIPKSIAQVDNSIFMRNKSGVDYEISLEKFPQVQIKQISLSDEMMSVLQTIGENNDIHQSIVNIFINKGLCQYGSHLIFGYYIQGKALTGNSLKDNESNNNGNSGEEKEKKENVLARIHKTNKEQRRVNSGDDLFQINNNMLKELRSDIRLKIQQARKFDAEYKQGEKRGISEPEGVAKDVLDLYKEIKTEKKKMRKDIEKKKDHRKNRNFDQ